MMFCKEYNARTADQPGMIIPVEITVFEVRARPAPRRPPLPSGPKPPLKLRAFSSLARF